MAGKQVRWARIRQLLQARSIDTHERLAAVLLDAGIVVSQATLSKDLRELGVVRVSGADGGFRYVTPEAGATLHDRRILERELRDYLLSVRPAENLLVLRTAAGHAQSVCEAVDRIGWDEVVGTIAGENTIFVATGSAAAAAALERRIAAVMGGGA
jgi:transcriptional regulator of arginine metabolism